jgi:diacylglycerol kinase (ATP)
MSENWFVIQNPISGNGRSLRRWPKFERKMREAGLLPHLFQTQQPLQEAELFRKGWQQGERNFLLVGGDGTYHGVVNALMELPEEARKEATLAMLPAGSGNDWCKTFQGNISMQRLVEWMKVGKRVWQDIGWVSYQADENTEKRYFMNVAGLGFDAYVAQLMLKSGAGGGSFAYFKSLLQGLFTYHSPQVHIQLPEETIKGKALILAAGVGRYFGGGMKICPQAQPEDGLLDITLVGDIGKLGVVGQLPGLYKGTFIQHPKVSQYQAREFSVTSEEKIFIQLDGELLGHTPARFGLIPQAIGVIGEVQ